MIKSIIKLYALTVLLLSYASAATVTVEPNDQTPTTTGETCAICLEQITSQSAESLPCAHVFDSPCIQKWLTIKSNCPVCKVSTGTPVNQSTATNRRLTHDNNQTNPYASHYYYDNTIDNLIITFDSNEEQLSSDHIARLWRELIEIRSQARLPDQWR
jgi:hypothetical protein